MRQEYRVIGRPIDPLYRANLAQADTIGKPLVARTTVSTTINTTAIQI